MPHAKSQPLRPRPSPADDHAREITHTLIDTLVLNYVSESSPALLPLDQIHARVGVSNGNGAADPGLTESLAALAERTHGVIVYDAQTCTAAFNPSGAGAPEVAAFNAACRSPPDSTRP